MSDDSDTGGAERAFEALRAEVTALRQAVETAPDYALTLGAIAHSHDLHGQMLSNLLAEVTREATDARVLNDLLETLVATQRRHTSLLAGLWRVLVGEARDDDPPWLRQAALIEAAAQQGSLLASIDQRLTQKADSDDRVSELLTAMADALATLDRDTTARLERVEARLAEVLNVLVTL